MKKRLKKLKNDKKKNSHSCKWLNLCYFFVAIFFAVKVSTTTLSVNNLLDDYKIDDIMFNAGSPVQVMPSSSSTRRQENRRLCTIEEVKHGAWVPIALDHPPYIPQKSKCYTKEDFDNSIKNKIWSYYHWHPLSYTNNECEFIPQFDADLFCHLATNKTIGMMGDSLTWEQFASLSGHLGRSAGPHNELVSKTEDGIRYNQQEPFTFDVCNGTSKIGFFRNRYLMYFQWFLDVVNPDIVLFNRGAHFPDRKELMEGFPGPKQNETGLINLIMALQRRHEQVCRTQNRNCLAIWRTTSPGHPSCKNFTQPSTNVNEMEEWIQYDLTKYPGMSQRNKWWEFIDINNLVIDRFVQHQEQQQQSNPDFKFNFEVMPGYDINILRPDGHVSEGDCLHNCDPGPADVYNVLLLHMMRLHSEKEEQF
jgi:hypothetical protein